MGINIQSGSLPVYTPPTGVSTRGASAPVLPQKIAVEPQVSQQVPDTKTAEDKRLEQVQRAAEATANTYVVSDVRFTIYKDNTGQYITRFTNLRDGKVTYIPEPDLIKHAKSAQTLKPLVSIDA